MSTTTPTGGNAPGFWTIAAKIAGYETAAAVLFKMLVKVPFPEFFKPALSGMFLLPFIAIVLEYWPTPFAKKMCALIFAAWVIGATLIGLPKAQDEALQAINNMNPTAGGAAKRANDDLWLNFASRIEPQMQQARRDLFERSGKTQDEVGAQITADYDALHAQVVAKTISDDEFFAKSDALAARTQKWIEHGKKTMKTVRGSDPNSGFSFSSLLPKKVTFGDGIFVSFLLAAGITLIQFIRKMVKGGGTATH